MTHCGKPVYLINVEGRQQNESAQREAH